MKCPRCKIIELECHMVRIPRERAIVDKCPTCSSIRGMVWGYFWRWRCPNCKCVLCMVKQEIKK